jgi:uncharacterized protein (DUF433 family)
MSEFTETTKFIKLNVRGTPILADTHTNIVPIGVAHESGVSEAELLDQYGVSRAQLHAALSYFYEHREEMQIYLAETERLLREHGSDGWSALDEFTR